MTKEEDLIDHIEKLVDLEWMGSITKIHFADRVINIITDYKKKRGKNG